MSGRYYNTDWQFEMFKRDEDNRHDTGFKCKFQYCFLIFSNICCWYNWNCLIEAIPMCTNNIMSFLLLGVSPYLLFYWKAHVEMNKFFCYFFLHVDCFICDASYPESWYEPIPRQVAPQSSAIILYFELRQVVGFSCSEFVMYLDDNTRQSILCFWQIILRRFIGRYC